MMNIQRFSTLSALLAASAMTVFADVVPPVTATAGSAFTVNFNGYASLPCAGDPNLPCPVLYEPLSPTIRFSDFAFTNVSGNRTQVTFRADVSNTSTAPLLTSYLSNVGFNTTPTILNSGNSVSGAYDTIVVSDTQPGFGQVEFCFSDVGNCAGSGSPAGVAQQTTSSAYASLYFAGSGLDSLTIDNIFVRYKGLTGVPGIFNGIGSPVPEPGAYLVLSACLGFLAFRNRKKLTA
jgi:hypothetical protein